MRPLLFTIALLSLLRPSTVAHDLWVIGQNYSGQLGDGTGLGRVVPGFIMGDVAQVSAGGDFTLIVKNDGTLWSTGYNYYGQLGDGTTLSRLAPVQIASEVAFAAAGYQTGFFVRHDGTLWAMGYNNYGQLGDGSSGVGHSSPVQVATGVTRVAAGILHTLIVKSDGSLWATGYNLGGQLGDGTTTSRQGFVQVAADVVDVAVGWQHSLFVKTDGTLWATGNNSDGQLGNGGSTDVLSPVQVATGVTRVAAGRYHSLFVKSDGTLWAMGGDSDGQLGIGGYYIERLPVQVATNVVSVAAGTTHSLFGATDGTLWATGDNGAGQLGNGTTADQRVPFALVGDVVQFSAGNEHTVFLRPPQPPTILQQPSALVAGIGQPATFEVATFSTLPVSYQWYVGTSGDIMQPLTGGTASSITTPALATESTFWVRASNAAGSTDSATITVQVTAAPEITLQPRAATIASGEGPVLFVAATGAGLTYQWFRGERGDTSAPVAGATGSTLVAPALTTGTLFWARVTNPAGSADSVAAPVTIVSRVATDLWVLGRNFDNELGTGTAGPARVPVRIATEVAQMAMGRTHNLFVRTDGSLWGMGSNNSGQLGLGSVGNTELVPVHAADEVVAAAAGTGFSLFVKSDATLWTVGYNSHGQLGDGIVSEFRTSPREVATNVTEVFAGAEHSLFIRTDGSLWGMGDNNRGQLGIGDDGLSRIPIKIADGVVRVATSRPPQYGAHTLFVTADGTLWAMGANSDGQLGDGSTTDRRTPVAIASNVVEVAVGDFFSLFLEADGTAWGMGSNLTGQLGDGTTTGTNSPIQVGAGIVHLGAGAFHSLLTRIDGTIEAAGANYNLQVGDAFENFSVTRVPIANGGGITKGTADGTMFLRMPTAFPPGPEPFPYLFAVGQPAVLSVAADSGLPYAFQWYLGLVGNPTIPLAGATNARVTTSPLAATTEYWVRITDHEGGTRDLGITAYITAAPGLAAPLARVTSTAGRSPVLSVAATGLGVFYQWYRGERGDLSAPIPRGGQATALLPPLRASANFWVRVINVAGTWDSDTIAVTIPPTLATNLFAAGANQLGQLGDGSTGGRPTPVAVAADAVWVTATQNDFGAINTLFVRQDGTLWATGGNGFGSFGDGTNTNVTTPIQVDTGVAHVATSGRHTLFVHDDGSLWAAGTNSQGQLGAGYEPGSLSPIQIDRGVAQAAAGRLHSMYLKTDGTLWLMGHNEYGQIGDGGPFGSMFNTRLVPVHVATGVVQIAAGGGHSLFLKADGSLWAMGRNVYGQLGDTTFTNRNAPVAVATGVVAVAAGWEHSLFLKDDGTLWAMGQNDGRLGDGTTTTRATPVQVASGVASCAAGGEHSVFVKTDGTLWTTGRNDEGALADGTTVSRLVPLQVATGVTQAVAGYGYTHFLQVPPGSVAASVTAHPANQSAAVRARVEFIVAGTGTPAPSYFQWQRRPVGAVDWYDLNEVTGYEGTGTAMLAVTPSSVGQDGDAFRCIVGNGVPPDAVSAHATLTVVRGSAGVALGALDHVYDGTPRAVTVTTDPAGLSVVITYAGGAAAPTDAGTYAVLATVDDVDFVGSASGVLSIAPVVQLDATGAMQSVSDTGISLDASFSGGGTATYQWQFRATGSPAASGEGVWIDLPDTNGPSLTISSAQLFHAGEYRAVVTVQGASAVSESVTVSVTEPPPSGARLTNLSTRALALTGDNVLIPGFVVAGPGNKQLLIRAVGPTLQSFGVNGVLPNPRLALKRWNGAAYEDVSSNDDWGTNSNAAAIAAKSADLSAFPLAAGSADAALLVDLAPGQYSAVAGDAGTQTGIAIVELYDADPNGGTARLINISNRGYVGAGDSIMIPGFVVSDEGPKTLLVRAVGPTLASFGVAGVLADPTLTIYRRNQTAQTEELILTNDDWSTGPGAQRTRDIAAQIQAFALPEGSNDAAFVVTLNPGIYTVHARGVNNTTGVALVEVYAVP